MFPDFADKILADAASIIQERLDATSSSWTHCHHCMWCLYLAGLVCWNFGFARTGSMRNQKLVADGQVISESRARQNCDEYLSLAVSLRERANVPLPPEEGFGKTSGLLIVLTGLLKSQSTSGLIQESSELLARIVGLKYSGI